MDAAATLRTRLSREERAMLFSTTSATEARAPRGSTPLVDNRKLGAVDGTVHQNENCEIPLVKATPCVEAKGLKPEITKSNGESHKIEPGLGSYPNQPKSGSLSLGGWHNQAKPYPQGSQEGSITNDLNPMMCRANGTLMECTHDYVLLPIGYEMLNCAVPCLIWGDIIGSNKSATSEQCGCGQKWNCPIPW